jgi:asparagine synthase (glutamine-hydrolysing)
MIVAAVGPFTAGFDAEWRLRLDRAAGSCPTYSFTAAAIALFAYAGSPAGDTDATGGRVWIGRLREPHTGRLGDYRGDFALAAAMPKWPGKLLLARGRFGGRPLYYAHATEGVLVCSRLDVLARILEDGVLSSDGLAAHVVRRSGSDPTATIYRRIRRVPAACALVLDKSGVSSRHDIGCDVRPVRAGNLESVAEELRVHVAQAVARAISTAGDVGVLVSGGLDSSFVLASALHVARTRPETRVHAVNLDFADRGDDRSRFRSLCDHLGVVPIRTTPRECAPLFLRSLVIGGAPSTWPTSPFDVRLTELGRENGANMVLTGVGGDDVFYGDFRLFAEDFRQGHPIAAILRAARLRGYVGSSAAFRVHRFVLCPVLRGLVPPRLLTAIDARRRRPPRLPWAGTRLRRLVAEGLLVDDSPDPNERLDERSWLCERMRSSYYSFVKESHALIEIAGGCTRVDPYFDDDLVEFVAGLRPELLFQGDWVRGLFRNAMRGVVPDDIRTRPDKGRYEAALLAVVQAAGGFDVLRPLSTMVGLADHGIVEPGAFHARFRELRERPQDGRLWMELWPVFAAEAFVRGSQEAT